MKLTVISIRETQRKYGAKAMTAGILIGFILILCGFKIWGKGLVLGTLFSIVNFLLMGEMVPLRLTNSSRKAFFISFGGIAVRYLIMAIPVVMAIKMAQFNIGGVICGLFMIQAVILAEYLLDLFFSRNA